MEPDCADEGRAPPPGGDGPRGLDGRCRGLRILLFPIMPVQSNGRFRCGADVDDCTNSSGGLLKPVDGAQFQDSGQFIERAPAFLRQARVGQVIGMQTVAIVPLDPIDQLIIALIGQEC